MHSHWVVVSDLHQAFCAASARIERRNVYWEIFFFALNVFDPEQTVGFMTIVQHSHSAQPRLVTSRASLQSEWGLSVGKMIPSSFLFIIFMLFLSIFLHLLIVIILTIVRVMCRNQYYSAGIDFSAGSCHGKWRDSTVHVYTLQNSFSPDQSQVYIALVAELVWLRTQHGQAVFGCGDKRWFYALTATSYGPALRKLDSVFFQLGVSDWVEK